MRFLLEGVFRGADYYIRRGVIPSFQRWFERDKSFSNAEDMAERYAWPPPRPFPSRTLALWKQAWLGVMPFVWCVASGATRTGFR
ncbi:hypothetical protein F443_03897 [Phytophthora nicotianae P1569]|uniref:Uncharacterized protein n=2 Tax=Phytophthora nicotianae TaxID=4792 RepID=V9FNP3_PHYNI|nr:hypothetical protein F443_03897 [Phytophthora nicotianae P1569]ETO81802.1 hypothetical protein F444_03959 [Phytophthora nicotianae P1976]